MVLLVILPVNFWAASHIRSSIWTVVPHRERNSEFRDVCSALIQITLLKD